jgi:ribulose 1,5-bisphosphate carboxylase large subunit-like protein
MPRHAIHLTDPKTGEKTKHILDLTEEEIKTLEAYLQYVAELGHRNCPAGRPLRPDRPHE